MIATVECGASVPALRPEATDGATRHPLLVSVCELAMQRAIDAGEDPTCWMFENTGMTCEGSLDNPTVEVIGGVE